MSWNDDAQSSSAEITLDRNGSEPDRVYKQAVYLLAGLTTTIINVPGLGRGRV